MVTAHPPRRQCASPIGRCRAEPAIALGPAGWRDPLDRRHNGRLLCKRSGRIRRRHRGALVIAGSVRRRGLYRPIVPGFPGEPQSRQDSKPRVVRRALWPRRDSGVRGQVASGFRLTLCRASTGSPTAAGWYRAGTNGRWCSYEGRPASFLRWALCLSHRGLRLYRRERAAQ